MVSYMTSEQIEQFRREYNARTQREAIITLAVLGICGITTIALLCL
jgi:hypothetical protein